ncbi:hypothetical protein [Sphingobium sp. KCTC 72723]|uniref:hypothetical protein n=1 Tax=Sphingobium sp. KCTC 72723 TaxID=2733867 RepID=UPI00165D52F8|nr:hypothetical protein [Sphingobium sp. KCTC 72723]
MTRRKNPGEKSKPRPINWDKYPRADAKRKGMHYVDVLFDNLTPPGWEAAQVRDPALDDGEAA